MFIQTRSRRTFLLTGLFLTAAGLSSCDESALTGGGDPAPDFSGVWEATEFMMVSQEESSSRIDLIAMGGGITVAIQPQGGFSGTVLLPSALTGQPASTTLPVSGVIRVANPETLRIDFVPEVPPLFVSMDPSFELIGDVLTVVDPTADFDFDQDGVEEPAVFQGVLERK